MLSESEKRAASLAVSRYGVDRARIRRACEWVLQAKTKGQEADLLGALVDQQLLTASQANELRLALDTTQLDPGGPHPAAATVEAESKSPARDTVDVLPPGSVYEPRTIGTFRILRPLGEGGMGSVYLGYHEGQSRHVAIKILPDHLAANQAYVDRFYREAKSGALLDHPNIVRTIAVGQDPTTSQHYLVLEYVDGPSAHALLNRFGKLSVGDAIHITLDVARALEHAHSRNIVHRDIKPDNILLTQSGVAKLADLGLSKRTDDATHLTGARQGFGTPYYMPYEQAMNARYVDGRCDIYALGATLYHLVTGEVPFAGASHLEILEKKDHGKFTAASAVNPAIPAALDRILEKMLARDPADRYQTASELIVDLERSGLSAPVPSFTDPDLALQDPLVRARLTRPAQPTRPDLDAPPSDTAMRNGSPDIWYLRYRNRDGRWCKTRTTTQQIVQRLREGRLPTNVEACHEQQGEFRSLATYPEFREAIAASPRKKRSPTSRRSDEPPVPEPQLQVQELAATSRQRLWLMLLGVGISATVVAGIGYLLAHI